MAEYGDQWHTFGISRVSVRQGISQRASCSVDLNNWIKGVPVLLDLKSNPKD